ncbi:MAG: J domain-containing protein [Chloroflexota bacterium]
MVQLPFGRKPKTRAGALTPEVVVAPPEVQQTTVRTLAVQHEQDVADALYDLPDLYAIIGVTPHASDETIKYAYRRKASSLVDRRWRAGQAARRLSDLNAAYEILGKPDRRADYDVRRLRQLAQRRTLNGAAEVPTAPDRTPRPVRAQRQGRRFRLGRAGGFLEIAAIAVVIGLAYFAATSVLSNRSLVDLSWITDTAESLGVTTRRRTAPAGSAGTPVPATATAASAPAAAAQAPQAPPPPAAQPAPAPAAPDPAARFEGTVALVSDPNPPRRSNVTVSMRVVRDGQPVANAPAYAVVHFRTTDERWPGGNGTSPTDGSGAANINFNIGDATAGFAVNVDVVALVDGEEIRRQVSFTPR